MKSMTRATVLSVLLSNAVAMAWTVHDPFNFGQNKLQFVKELAHFAKQVEDMERTAARIEYEINAAKRLGERLKNFKLTSINSIVRQINSLRSRARSIGYAYESVANQFETFYSKGSKFSQKFKAWQKQSDESIKDAMVSQGLIERSQKHMVDLDKVLEDKRNAGGDADTLQALGEINAIQSKQLADLTEIVATDARAKQSVIMENRAKEQELKDYEAHLMKDFNIHGKSRPLTHLPSLGTTAPRR
jgi:P-type conjugative transfer protein TrbJ